MPRLPPFLATILAAFAVQFSVVRIRIEIIAHRLPGAPEAT